VSQSLNAVVTVLDPGAPGSGPLAGLRFGIKDNIGIAGVASTCASAFFADRIAAADAEVVSRLRDAGASLVATLNMAEFAMGVTSQNSVHGGTSTGSPAGRAAAPERRSRPGPWTSRWAPTPAARCGSPPP
jgi:aspartyl-tRNA(Asn)/glutamyl-tRNA(Gln) amidotransferase subunit A